MTTAAIIVAAGRGLRAGGGTPKQWRRLGSRTVADWTIGAFRQVREIATVVLVLNTGDTEAWETYADSGLVLVKGGENRADSVRNGLQALEEKGISRVLIHDVARPCVTPALIGRVLEALDTVRAAAPGLPVTDALWTGEDGSVTGTRNRSGLFAAQTPQGFDYATILAAHRAAGDSGAADDVEIARQAGIDVRIVPGDPDNIKITTEADFARAEKHLEGAMDVRLGNGFDVHAFGPGDRVTLCGVNVPHDHGLVGHSDADVGMHAVTDAIYGALAQGDIGRHFPPSDPQWKGAASHIFLSHAVDLAAQMGFRLTHADITLVCEYPKIGPHADRMRGVMADIMGVTEERVSVKATTAERLGFTGRGEGIAALATATLVRR